MKRVTVAADKAYDTKDFVAVMRDLNVTPHVTQNEKRPAAAPSTGAPHGMPDISSANSGGSELRVFRWMKTVGMLRKTRHRGVFKVG